MFKYLVEYVNLFGVKTQCFVDSHDIFYVGQNITFSTSPGITASGKILKAIDPDPSPPPKKESEEEKKRQEEKESGKGWYWP